MEYRIFIIDQRTYTEHFLGGFNDLWAMRRAVDQLSTCDPDALVFIRDSYMDGSVSGVDHA